MSKQQPGITVIVYSSAEGYETHEVHYPGAEMHISTHGVLVIRRMRDHRVVHAYSAGTWHSAKDA